MSTLRTPNNRLRALLGEAGWTQEALARAVNNLGTEVGARLGYDRTAVAHWLSGTEPRDPAPRLVAEALSRRLRRSVTPQAAGFRSAPAEPPAADPVLGFTALCRADADADARAVLRHRPYRVAEAAAPVPPPRGQRRTQPRPLPRPRGPLGQPAALHDAARFFSSAIDTHGGRTARTALSAFLADDVTPILHRSLPVCGAGGGRSELLSAAGGLGFLLGRMHEDGQLHGLAQHYYGYAQRLAHEAGDRTTWAVVVRAMSAQAAGLEHHRAARRLAEAAAAAVGNAPGPIRAYVYAQAAVARARTGDRRGCLEALAAAEGCAAGSDGGAPAAPGGGPFQVYPAAALSYQSSVALEALGDVPAALSALRRSVLERAEHDVRGRSLSQYRFGGLLLRAGRLEEACVAWHGFLDGRAALRSGAADRAARELRGLLRPYRHRQGVRQVLSRVPVEQSAGCS